MEIKIFSIVSDKNAAIRNMPHLRIWIIVANRKTVRIFKYNNGSPILIDRIAPDQSGYSPIICSVRYGQKIMLRYNPGIYAQNSRFESISFSHKVLARLDEALWNDDFDQIVLLSEPDIMGALLRSFSQQVRARAIAFIKDDIARLDNKALQKKLYKTVIEPINSWEGYGYGEKNG